MSVSKIIHYTTLHDKTLKNHIYIILFTFFEIPLRLIVKNKLNFIFSTVFVMSLIMHQKKN